MEERLISRFGWGLTVAIEPPELEMRVAIVLKKAEAEGVALHEDIAFFVAKHVRSNAIVLAGPAGDKAWSTVGIGAGQMSRVDAVKLVGIKPESRTKGSVMSSDAYFPFRDGLDEAVALGATAIIQPGGSIRDQEVIDAANGHGIAMVFTGIRLFRH